MSIKQKSFFFPPGSETIVNSPGLPLSIPFMRYRSISRRCFPPSVSALQGTSVSFSQYHAISRVSIGDTPSSTAVSFLQSRSGLSFTASSTCSGTQQAQSVLSRRSLVLYPREHSPHGGDVVRNALHAVDDPAVPDKDYIAVTSHYLSDKSIRHDIAYFIGAFKIEGDNALQAVLAYRHELSTGKVLSQQHAEHRRLLGILERSRRRGMSAGKRLSPRGRADTPCPLARR